MTIERNDNPFRYPFHERPEFLVLTLFFLGTFSIPLAVAVLVLVLRAGHSTGIAHAVFREGPKLRGTLNIIFVCMSTIFTSVYVSVHTDVPNKAKAKEFAEAVKTGNWARLGTSDHEKAFTRQPARSRRNDTPSRTHHPSESATRSSIPLYKRFFAWLWVLTSKPLFRRVVWMGFNVFAPELVVFIAILERISAKSALEFMERRGQTGWTMQLAFFADMGGFQLEDGRDFRSGMEFMRWLYKHDIYFTNDSIRGKHVRAIIREVEDRSKANMVLKVFACAQAAWLLVQAVVRIQEHKAVSELEVASCSYVFCTLITYICWLDKPYGVLRPVVLRKQWFHYGRPQPLRGPPRTLSRRRPGQASAHKREETEAFVPRGKADVQYNMELDMTVDLSSSGDSFQDMGLMDIDLTVSVPSLPTTSPTDDRRNVSPDKSLTMLEEHGRFTPFNRSFVSPDTAWKIACSVSGTVGFIIGVIHAVPLWDAVFINTTGQWMWRGACILQASLPLYIASICLVPRWGRWRYLALITILIAACLYAISRIVLFGLTWISFGSLPESVYEEISWASIVQFPHFQ